MKREKEAKRREDAKERRKKMREEFKKKSKIEREEIKKKINITSEFPYIGKLMENAELRSRFKQDFDNGKIILCDPGKRSILYMMASNKIIHKREKNIKTNNYGVSIWKDRKFLNYTSNTRKKLTKRTAYSNLIEKWKGKSGQKGKIYDHKLEDMINIYKDDKDNVDYFKKLIEEKEMSEKIRSEVTLKDLEKDLTDENSKSCSLIKFMKYCKLKTEYNKYARENYKINYLNKLKWYSYINKKRHEDELLSVIENEFGKDIKIVIGDWSNKGRVRYISTPNIGIKKKLKERFEVYLIDEYLTSKIHYKHNVECENIKIEKEVEEENEIKTRKVKLHSVLSYTKDIRSGCKLSGCINRDKNAVLNMTK